MEKGEPELPIYIPPIEQRKEQYCYTKIGEEEEESL